MTEQQGAVLGRKADLAKARWDLVPLGVMRQVVEVLTRGAAKYAPDNWMFVPAARERYYAAAQRHIDAWWHGELRDPEMGTHHLANAACCLMFLMWFDNQAEQAEQATQSPARGETDDEEAKDETAARAATTTGPRTALRRAEPQRFGDTVRR